jgi:hypothetical protein
MVTLALAALLGLGVLLFTAIDTKPLVDRGETVSTDAIDQARNLLLANDPRRLRPGEERSAVIPAALLDEGINYVATRALHGRGALALQEESAEVRLSLRLPGTPGYLNLRATVPEAAGEPRIATASIGNVPVPAFVADVALSLALGALGYEQQWRMTRGAIRELAFDPGRGVIDLRYVWSPELLETARRATD